MSTEDKVSWTKLSEKLVRTSPYYIQAEKQYRLPNGKHKTAFVGNHRPFVIGLALTKNKEVILVKEYRPGPEKLMLDLPSGSIEEGEDPIEAMRRELREETGWLGTPELVNVTHTGPYSNQMRHTFVVHDCVKVGPQELDHDEFIEVVVMPLEEFYEKWVATGVTTNGSAVLFCLHHLGLLKFQKDQL